jgi:hypothetical protein
MHAQQMLLLARKYAHIFALRKWHPGLNKNDKYKKWGSN